MRLWVNQADIDDGEKPGVSTNDAARVKELEQEVRDLRRANEILRRAATFFGAELDRHLPSVYCAAKTRPASARSQRDVLMTTELVAPWHDNDRVYGARKLWRPPAAPAATSAATRSPG